MKDKEEIKPENKFPFDYDLSKLVRISFDNFDMLVTKRYEDHYKGNNYEKFTSDLFLNFIKEDSVVIDVGANYGYYSLLAATKNKKGKIYAIEPVKENFEVLNKNVQENKFSNIETLSYAISDKSGEGEFNVTEASDSAGFYDRPHIKTLEKRIVKITSLDDFFKSQKIDAIKIDTEGHEVSVLIGMKKIIENNPEIKLFIELNPKCLIAGGHKAEDLLEKIKGLGLDIYLIKEKERKVYKISNDIYSWTNFLEPKEYCNLLCVKKNDSFFVSFFSHLSTRGGAELSLLELIRGMAQRDVLCHVILPWEGYLLEELKKMPVSIDIMPLPWWTYAREEDKSSVQKEVSNSCIELALLIENIGIDVIYTNTSVIPQGAIIAKLLDIPHIWHINEYGEKDHKLKFLLAFEDRAKFIYNHSQHVIFNSKALKNYFEQFVPDNKLSVAYYNVALDKAAGNSNDNKIFKNKSSLKVLLAGNYQPGKRQMDAVKAVEVCIKKMGIDAELVMIGRIGSSDYHKELQDYIRAHDLAGKVSMLGFLDNPSVAFSESDIVLMCSESEAFGRVTIEAMLMGKPVIGANAGATPELITDGVNGFLYEIGDYQALAEKIAYFCKNKEQIKEFGKKGKAFAENTFSDAGYSGKIYEILKKITHFKKSGIPNFVTAIISRAKNNSANEIKQNDQEIKKLNQAIQQKDQEIMNLNQTIQQKNQELVFVQSSKFWKLREIYLNIKNKIFFWKSTKYQPKEIKVYAYEIYYSNLKKFIPKFIFKLLAPLLKEINRKQLPAIKEVAIKRIESRNSGTGKDKYFDFVFSQNNTKDDEFIPFREHDALESAIKLIAFYLPQFHPIAENNLWWGEGFTEWTNVTRAVPQFIGHYQPRLPGELGFYDLRLIDVQKRQIELARNYGLYGFCYHFYWFNGKMLLEKPLQNLLENKELDFPFCINWANENWTRRWDGLDQKILIEQKYSPEDDIEFIKTVSKYFDDKRYIKINNRPLLVVYRPSLFPDPLDTTQRWRNYCRKNGIGEIYLVLAHSFDDIDPRIIGFDAALEFAPNCYKFENLTDRIEFLNSEFSGTVLNYKSAFSESNNRKKLPYVKYRGVCPSWDNEPRKPGKGIIFRDSNPENYRKWLENACYFTDKQYSNEDNIIFVNAWNEWAEGAYLEPDRKFGYSYLEATYNTLKKFDKKISNETSNKHSEIKKNNDLAVILHLHYLDMWEEIKKSLKSFGDKFDLHISLNNDTDLNFIRKVRRDYPGANVYIFENRGRDILPFLEILKKVKNSNYSFICKIHSKKSPHRLDGDIWRKQLFNNVIGSQKRVEEIISILKDDHKVGMIVSSENFVKYKDFSGSNQVYIEYISKELGIDFDGDFHFTAGSMFWFRPDALKLLTKIKIDHSHFPIEDGQLDGTMAHAIERCFCLISEKSGYVVKTIDSVEK